MGMLFQTHSRQRYSPALFISCAFLSVFRNTQTKNMLNSSAFHDMAASAFSIPLRLCAV